MGVTIGIIAAYYFEVPFYRGLNNETLIRTRVVRSAFRLSGISPQCPRWRNAVLSKYDISVVREVGSPAVIVEVGIFRRSRCSCCTVFPPRCLPACFSWAQLRSGDHSRKSGARVGDVYPKHRASTWVLRLLSILFRGFTRLGRVYVARVTL